MERNVPKVLETIRTAAADCRALNNTMASNELLDAAAVVSALLEALFIHHNNCIKTDAGYSESGDDRVAFRATRLAISRAMGE